MSAAGITTFDPRLQYLRHNGPEHVLAFAPTRSGKGVGLVIPTLLAWAEWAVIYDIKGENWAKTAGFRASSGHLCFKFSPVEDGTSPGSIRWPKFGYSLRAMSPTRKTSRT